MSNRYYVDAGTATTKIFNELPLLEQPSCTVIRGGYGAKAVCSGDEALALSPSLKADEQLVFPISSSGILNQKAACAMLKDFMSRAGIRPKDEVTAVISCGASIREREETEQLFFRAGYRNISLVESLLVYGYLTEKYPSVPIAVIGAGRTDVGILDKSGIVIGYSLDIGGDTVDERIRNKVEKLYKIRITSDTAKKLKHLAGSLNKNDFSSLRVTGSDLVTGVKKAATVQASDIYSEIDFCYGRILKVIIGMLDAAPQKHYDNIEKTGIFFAGGGANMNGLDDYVYKKLPIGSTIINNCRVFE